MRTIAHLSDLHFGVTEASVSAAAIRWLNSRSPSLAVISGDLTQRARQTQFRAAQSFIRQIDSPRLIVPGNHDIPLFDLVRRFRAPLSFYQRYIGRDLNPVYSDSEVVVQGLNTARPTTWQTGRVSESQLKILRDVFSSEDPRIKILVTHHPLLRLTGPAPEPAALRPAAPIIALCQAQGVDLLLAGHFHQSHSKSLETLHRAGQKPLYAIRAGTAISRRLRQEPNALNWIMLDEKSIRVEVHRWTGGDFELSHESVFPRISYHFS